MEEKTEKFNKQINKMIIKICIPMIITLIIEIFFGILNGGFFSVISVNESGLIFSILIIYIIFGIFIGLTRKLSISTIIVSCLCFIYLIINQMKIAYTGEMLVFSDINFVPNLDSIINLITFKDLLILVKLYLFPFAILIFIFIFIIRWTIKNDIIINNSKIRIIAMLTCAVILIVVFMPNKYTKTIFLNMFLNADEGSYTTSVTYCDNYSLITGIYGILLNDRFAEPKNYDEEELNNILEEYNRKETNKTWGKPNIIVVFSESFWDIDKQTDVEFNQQVAPNIKKLKEEGKLIETLSCAYGRLSENIAFELLTGGSVNYFSKGYIPIMSLYKRNNSEEIPSILKELKKNNYTSKIIFGEDYYNSEKTMRKIGFDEYIDVETEESKEDINNISDEYITDLIIKELENKQNGERIFYMTETIQNHMPFFIEKYQEYDISIKQSKLTSEENQTILSYAQGVYDADKQLARLYEYIKKYEEPTIIIFLGDHLPYLYTEKGNNALESISYFNTEDELENIYRKYNTQTLILSNYNINTENMPNYLSNNLLLTYIINQMDINLSSYYKWLYSTTEDLPAINYDITQDINGKIYSTQELKGNMLRVNKLREHMQYKLFVNPIE